MAKVMVETDNGELLVEDDNNGKTQAEKNRNKKVSKNKVNDKKKLIAQKKKKDRLDKEYSNCLAGDKFSNDEDKIKYESSSTIMVKAIEYL